MHDELSFAFEAHDATMAPFLVWEQEFIEKDHGRIGKRSYSAVWDIKDLEAKENWPGLKCIGKVRSTREENGKISDETR